MPSVSGNPSTDRYLQALAVCNGLAELTAVGSEAEFVDRLRVLMCLKRHWAVGDGDAKVVRGSGEELPTVDDTQVAAEIESMSWQNMVSHASLTLSQPVLVLCSKTRTNDGTICGETATSENIFEQAECYRVLPAMLTVPTSGELIIMYEILFSVRLKYFPSVLWLGDRNGIWPVKHWVF